MKKQPLGVFYKKIVHENFAKFTRKHLYLYCFLFNKVAALSSSTLFKKETLAQVFPVNFAMFLRTPILKNNCERLLPLL